MHRKGERKLFRCMKDHTVGENVFTVPYCAAGSQSDRHSGIYHASCSAPTECCSMAYLTALWMTQTAWRGMLGLLSRDVRRTTEKPSKNIRCDCGGAKSCSF